jgi:integrase
MQSDATPRWPAYALSTLRNIASSSYKAAAPCPPARRALTDHIADWRAALLAKANTLRHAELVTCRASKAFDACGFRFWSDIAASRLVAHLGKLREESKGAEGEVVLGVSAQTFNFYLQAAKQFCVWMVRDGRASASPLAHIQGVSVTTDRRHDRRALSADELRRLLDSTRTAATRAGITGAERAMLYRLAVETGLRAGELRSLTRGSFWLEGKEPSVTVAAAYSKNRREAVQPLLPSTAAELQKHLANKLPTAPAFPMPKPNMVARIMRADLAVARQAWIEAAATAEERQEREQSTDLAYRDDAGRVFDFHALRHTFISNLAAGGVHPKTAQQLARHSTITLTMDRYSHTYRGQLADALNVLPDLSRSIPQVLVATGTDGNPTENCVPAGVPAGGSNRLGRVAEGDCLKGQEKTRKALVFQSFTGISGETGIRTPDTDLTPYNGLANRRLQPLGHLSRRLDMLSAVSALVK